MKKAIIFTILLGGFLFSSSKVTAQKAENEVRRPTDSAERQIERSSRQAEKRAERVGDTVQKADESIVGVRQARKPRGDRSRKRSERKIRKRGNI
ncbi:hypothetical protein [Dyadobacter aurulentus]|uniref:hypothetical protein n=1 Tax=Dyadobacter sp. UC 10 TaxID=2605428 RepID=UPI0011F3FAFF|nr:hypothetical protein [Dyadobacter sp. UC 10]KAA0992071.1 hypothetical protein FXO21_18770 [Dyadobacter sp. UC 10]